MRKLLHRAFCTVVHWLVFRAPMGPYKEERDPEGAHCYRTLGPVQARVFYCRVVAFQSYELSIDIWDYHVSLRDAVGPERDCAFTGIHCFRRNLRPRLPTWLRRRYRYTKNRITLYLIPQWQYKLATRGLAPCPICRTWGCRGNCVPF